MKHGKIPTRNQKILIESSGRKAANWLVVKDTAEKLEIVSRINEKKGISKTRIIYK